MVKWVLVIGSIFNGTPDQHAYGYFSSEDNCWKFFNYNNDIKLDLLASCYKEKTFQEAFPDLKIERNES